MQILNRSPFDHKNCRAISCARNKCTDTMRERFYYKYIIIIKILDVVNQTDINLISTQDGCNVHT
jgi:hypothetical protein